MTGAFHRAWNRFAACVVAWAPAGHAALRAPATAERIAELEAASGFGLHPALRTLLELHDGAEEILPAAFLPRSCRSRTAWVRRTGPSTSTGPVRISPGPRRGERT
ncbi:SMI1/KNR4 family protein [Streptacidiphilus jiangxiensis]|uniref:Uncharacterized protein n=1 Tax=Streptacidiphilus jiangxiensis TaxID=235985 RepID=A0A1H7ZAB1_STRJI|nr:SMI1/KNR4 family protein [Streptacidiphilus jiangxiensis]SEM54934.1 hypothetical protein SAMN05414137_13360 [Streptacidiphilus jiangxiensis]